MKKYHRDLRKIVKNEGGKIIKISSHNSMNKVKIDFGGNLISYSFSSSNNYAFPQMMHSQIKQLKRRVV